MLRYGLGATPEQVFEYYYGVPAPATSTTTTTTREVDYVPFVCGHAQWSRPNF